MPKGRKDSNEALGRSDRWPSDYGKREQEAQVKKGSAARKSSKKVANVDEQGERANVRQNTPPKDGLAFVAAPSTPPMPTPAPPKQRRKC